MWLAAWSEEPTENGTMPHDVTTKYLGVYGALGVGQGKECYLFLICTCFLTYDMVLAKEFQVQYF